MTIRTVTIVFLFFAGVATAGVTLALTLSIAIGAGVTPGPWLMPAITFASFVGVFFLGRDVVLPPGLATPAHKALGMLSLWMGATLAASTAIVWAASPLMAALGVEHGSLVIGLGCLIASVAIFDRLTARRGRGALP